MKIEGTHELNAPRERVYALLTDPEVLRRCIPGCESLEKTAENTYATSLKAGRAAIKGNFKGNARLQDMRPPEHYRIRAARNPAPVVVKGTATLYLPTRYSGPRST